MAFDKKVFICSPFAPVVKEPEKHDEELKRNIMTAQAVCLYALSKGKIPCAPHLYFTQFMNDTDPDIREFGLKLGFEWLEQCSELWVIGRRTSDGMKKEIEKAEELGIPVKHYVFERCPEERILDAIFFPEINFIEMD